MIFNHQAVLGSLLVNLGVGVTERGIGVLVSGESKMSKAEFWPGVKPEEIKIGMQAITR